ncbi:MAG: histidinol-phosphatase [Cyclobacteriaceae bacterium]
MLYNLHSHTHFCDGTDHPSKYLEAAIRSGLKTYGYSSHAPVPFDSPWNMKQENLANYFSAINRIKVESMGQIEIYCGLEADYIPDAVLPEKLKSIYDLDYVIGSIHFIVPVEDYPLFEADGQLNTFQEGVDRCYHGDHQMAVKRYFQLIRMMIEEGCPDIVGHLDKIKKHNQPTVLFSESEPWYQDEIMQTLEVIKNKEVTVEVNTRGLYKKLVSDTYPSLWILEEMHKRNIEITLSSDAHKPEEITGRFEYAIKQLTSVGYRWQRTLVNGSWQKVPLS